MAAAARVAPDTNRTGRTGWMGVLGAEQAVVADDRCILSVDRDLGPPVELARARVPRHADRCRVHRASPLLALVRLTAALASITLLIVHESVKARITKKLLAQFAVVAQRGRQQRLTHEYQRYLTALA